MLLMLGAKPAVVRAPFVRLDPDLGGDFARKAVLHLVVMRDVGANKIFADPVRRTPLSEVNPLPWGDDLRRDQSQAVRAKALRRPKERVVAELGHRRSPFPVRAER